MRSVAFSMAGVSVFGLGLSALIAFVAAADDVKNVQVGGKTYQARTVNGRTFLTRGIEELKTRQLEAPLPVEDSSDRQTIE